MPQDATPVAHNGHEFVSFGAFQADLRAGELRKGGIRIKLHRQPFEILRLLLERPGDLVTREELQRKLWPSDTFVDFEHGLNKAINKVREALGDNADSPRYIETVPRRGYRFIGSVAKPTATEPPPEIVPLPPAVRRHKRWVAALCLAALCVLGMAGFYLWQHWNSAPKVLKYRQLTTDGQLKGIGPCNYPLPALVTDGPRVFFAEPDSSISQVSATGGEVAKVSSSVRCFVLSDISPDKTELLGLGNLSEATFDQPLWRLSLADGHAFRIGDLSGHAPAWAPDGERIIYATGNDLNGPSEVYVARKDGNEQRRLFRMEEGWVRSIHWSPVGNIVHMVAGDRLGTCSLWEFVPDGSPPHKISLFPGDPCAPNQQAWTPDGRYAVLAAQGQIWTLREAKSVFGSNAKPLQLTTGAMSFASPTASPDGKHIFVLGSISRGQLARYDLKSQRLEPYLSGISADHLDFSYDGNWVCYVSYPDGSLWRSRLDGTERMQLTTPPLDVAEPRWSHDGTLIAFTGFVEGDHLRIYVVPAEGGKPQLVEQVQGDAVDPTWAPDGKSLIFGPSQWSAHGISSVELSTGRVSVIPESEGLYSPRVSPNGRFIVAQNAPANDKLLLFDQQTQKWTVLLDSTLADVSLPGWPQWSGDSSFVYFQSVVPGTRRYVLYRVAIADHQHERMAEIDVPEGTIGTWGSWMGVTPDGSPLVLRNRSIVEVYALDVDLP